jgi:hypothetical protein
VAGVRREAIAAGGAEKHDQRIEAAEADLIAGKRKVAGAEAASARDLAEMTAMLDGLDELAPKK